MTATVDASAPVRLIFVDDSGDSRTVPFFAGIEVPQSRLGSVMGAWAGFRAGLASEVGLRIPKDAPLHANELVAGRGRAAFQARDSHHATHLDRCREVVRHGLMAVGAMPDVTVSVVYRFTEAYKHGRPALFEAFMAKINARLAAAGEYGVVIVDGNGTDATLRTGLRRIPPADLRIRELRFTPAREHDLLQAADLVAYAAYQDVAKREERRFMWGWSALALRADADLHQL
ncbi:DUF3800 domain-containing protein [Kitasatospora sp. NPDC018619]|uniref:DUF3800 domain-containing protein n=1 Tax=unclassified Kitasatospora TaxID=2633591 RepID=UPI003793B86C